MKSVLIYILCLASVVANAAPTLWQRITSTTLAASRPVLTPNRYDLYELNTTLLSAVLTSAGATPEEAVALSIPSPDGSLKTYRVWETPIMEAPLAARYPSIKTFSGYLAENRSVTIKLGLTTFGFHAMIYDGGNTFFIDPYSWKGEDGLYICYYKRDYSRPAGHSMVCSVPDETPDIAPGATYLTQDGLPPMQYKVNGTLKRTFRLALACTGEYAIAVAGPNPNKADVFSKMVISMNRVNGVYEKELAVTMVFVANNDTLIFLDPSTDPYVNTSGDLGNNQVTISARIGAANYDIGHLFGTGGGGVAELRSVCKNDKARGLTGSSNPQGDAFDIDYVAHEMGHQFGANHTFNANSSGCSGNGVSSEAYEPGSGSTIMAYAGLCGSANNLQNNSDEYFHAISLSKITDFLTANNGATCAVTSPSGNTPPDIPAFTQSYSIPVLTPFELTAPEAVDSDHDEALTYSWEQWNRGDFLQSWNNVRLRGCIFRSFMPDTSRTRIFPKKDRMLQGVTSYLGEKLPDTTRFLTFRLTVRDVFNGIGTFNFPDDTIHLNATHTAGPFKVLTPSAPVNWMGGSTQTITWDVANTDMAPVSCPLVDIYFSEDGGNNFPYLIKAGTDNDGTEDVVIPNLTTTNQARIKVKCANNVFFNVNSTNFTVTHDPNNVPFIAWQNQVTIYPVPATDLLRISISNNMKLEVTLTDAFGRAVWQGMAAKELNIPVDSWTRGFYYVQLTEPNSGARIVKPVLLQ